MPKKERAGLCSPVVQQPAPIIQRLPEGRVRIDPTVRKDLMEWIFTVRCRYDRMAKQSTRGMEGRIKAVRIGQIEYARRMLELFDTLTESIFSTLKLASLQQAQDYLAGTSDRLPEVE
jgi:hypothetical protein